MITILSLLQSTAKTTGLLEMDETDFEPSPAQGTTQATPVKSTSQAKNPGSHVKGTPRPLAVDSDDEGDDETIDVTAMKAFAK